MKQQQQKSDSLHKKKMKKLKVNIDASISAANIERGIGILLTGNGKGKSTSAFGMVIRSLGYNHKVGIVQFIKGQQLSGEEVYVRDKCPSVTFYQMNTGFTWETQDRSIDIAAAKESWAVAEKMLQDDSYNLVVLDELTYMLSFKYLDEATILDALNDRPIQSISCGHRSRRRRCFKDIGLILYLKLKQQSMRINQGIMARKGVDL
jgi:cob(I)alamin adenosyltransferase